IKKLRSFILASAVAAFGLATLGLGAPASAEDIKVCVSERGCIKIPPEHPLYPHLWEELRLRRPSRVRVKRPSPRVIPVPKQEEGAPIGYPGVR
ncbi:hypothetical protein EBU71_22185, partial [bacterium]|nr:hypothetical protein [Candidatus Elulimicrobium humile]